MNSPSPIQEILQDSNYNLSFFSAKEIQDLSERIIIKKNKKEKNIYYAPCLIRKKEIKLTPEEIVRQLYLDKLIHEHGYPTDKIQLEYAVHFGREVKRADIVIFDKKDKNSIYIIVETKKPKEKEGKEQLKSYCNATGASLAVWTNGEKTLYYHKRLNDNQVYILEDLSKIPHYSQTVKEMLREKFTYEDLKKVDLLEKKKKSLKEIVLGMEEDVLANSGEDVFEEVFKLIFIKLFDELQVVRDIKESLDFRNYGESDLELKEKLENLFTQAKRKWGGVFENDTKINLTPSHLAICVSKLQDVKLFNSNLEIIDEAFEYLVNKSAKGDKGQYFTPRYVIDMIVKMMNPQEEETMIDTASGSCGFPIHTIFHVWKAIYEKKGLPITNLFTAEEKIPRAIDYVTEKVFGIDFDPRSVRVSRMLNIIAGDGRTNVLNLNSLDFESWDIRKEDRYWDKLYGGGFNRLIELRADEKSNKEYTFDLVLANPPFAGDIQEVKILSLYELAKKEDGKGKNKVGRDILFIERNLNMLKKGGRMAVVLPQGRFNNSSDKSIREYIARECRILAVVGLHGNVFKPHTGTKTSVLFVQKWDEKLCPKKEDYPIFFATMRKSSKDNSGEKIYLKDSEGKLRVDSHGHLIVDHDLFNHEGETQDGIAEAFLEFAKKEGFSFVGK